MRKAKRGKRLLAFLSALAVATVLAPGTVLAAGTECADGDSCTAHVAAIDNIHYDTLQEAIDDAASGSEITLLKSTAESRITFSREGTYTLDLHGNTLSTNATGSEVIALKTPNLTLTIRDGSLTSDAASTYGIYAYNTGNPNVTGNDYANLNLTLDSVTLTTQDQPLGVQGMNSNQNVTVKDSTITSPNVAIYFPPKSGTLTIDNSTISGVTNGIVMKGGNLVVKGEDTQITASGPKKEQDKPYTGKPGGGGFPKTGDAIYIEGGYTIEGGAARPIDVVIQDGVVESANADAVAVQFLDDPDTQTAEVTGGIFTSDVSAFASSDASVIEVTGNGDTLYYLGTPAVVSQRVADAVQAGDSITVTQGDADLAGLPDGVTVTNTGNGDVLANGSDVTNDPIITHTHVWGEPVWNWAADNSSATAAFTCQKDPTHTQTVTASMSSSTTAASCTKDGATVYTATVTLDGQTYTSEKTVVIPAVGHQYENGVCTLCGATEHSDNPHTGDFGNLMLPVSLMFLTAFGASTLMLRKKHSK